GASTGGSQHAPARSNTANIDGPPTDRWRLSAALAAIGLRWRRLSARASAGRTSDDAGRRHPRTQVQHRLGVDLRHPALGDAEHLADLGQGQSLVVVQREHELLALGQLADL